MSLAVAFHLTHACNLRCHYCYTGAKFAAGMSESTAERAIEFCLAEAGRQEVDDLEVIFFGGEPLLEHALLCQIVDRFRQRVRDRGNALEVSFKMSTNGLLLTPSVIEDLAAREVYVSVSIDGPPEVQDRHRPGSSGGRSSEELARIIPRLLEWNPCANVTCVITPTSAPRIDGSVSWLFDMGFRYISTTLDYSGAWTRLAFRELGAAYKRLGKWYIDKTLDGAKFYLSCFDERIRSHTRGPLRTSERCSFGQGQFSIAPSGRLYPCVQFVREDDNPDFVIGDVDHGFDEARRSRLHACSEGDKPECQGCAIRERCSSWCACANWQTTGCIDRASPIVCMHDRLLMPIVDRVANDLWRRRNPLFIHKHYNPAFPVLNFIEDVLVKEK